MNPLEIARLLGIKDRLIDELDHRTTQLGTTELCGDAKSISRLYWAGYHEGQQKASWPTTHTTFQLGDAVEKTKGSSWHGKVVGWYSTDLTSEGYCVESYREPGSVQIYPAPALRRVYEPDLECFRNEDPLT
jgi:hypothetical protein